MFVLSFNSTKYDNANLHQKWQQTLVWEEPQGGGGVFLKLYCGPETSDSGKQSPRHTLILYFCGLTVWTHYSKICDILDTV